MLDDKKKNPLLDNQGDTVDDSDTNAKRDFENVEENDEYHGKKFGISQNREDEETDNMSSDMMDDVIFNPDTEHDMEEEDELDDFDDD